MDAPTPPPTVRFHRFLPYWAVLQTDIRQTLRGWVYRLWVLVTIGTAAGSMAYQVGAQREAGLVQAASVRSGDVFRGLLAGGLGLVALLAVSGVASERGTVADAVLSRAISRHQYFLAKMHARAAVVLGTFAVTAAGVLVAHSCLFDPDLSLSGGLAAVGMGAAVLAAIVACGVTVGALSNGTVIGITVFWLLLSGSLVAVSALPDGYPTPDRVLGRLRFVLQGHYDPAQVVEVVGAAAAVAGVAAAVGLVGFARKDV